MPVAINRHGVPSIVTEAQWDEIQFLTPGDLRLASEEDWAVLEGDTASFSCPWVWEHERGCFGSRPVLIIGGGESMNNDVRGAYRMVCNPRPYSPKADAVVAIDSVYWTHSLEGETTLLCDKYPHLSQADFFVGPSGPIPHTGQGKNQYRFGYPIFPLKTGGSGAKDNPNPGLALRVGNSIRNANICGVAAWLLARYLTNGPIIFTGFDLRGKDIAGNIHDYEKTQLHKWQAVAWNMDNTYVHDANSGPLREMFPIWRAA